MATAAPLPLIQLDESTKQLKVCDEARQLLQGPHGPVGVCSVAGVYRTGKSYILNQLAGKNRGFGIGSSVQACTKGIWVWGAPLQLGSNADGSAPQYLLLLDTEGLQSISQTEGHDAKIFCLALLLSSFFVYNSEKAINNAAIDQLALVAQLTEKIRVRAEGSGDAGTGGSAELADFFPTFLWLLRDFQLELTDAQGRQQTPDEYLESCLEAQPGSSAAIAERNQTKEAIRTLFRRRSCLTLRHPTLGTSLPDEALKQLPELDRLHPDFKKNVLALKKTVFSSVRAKMVGGVPLTGGMLVHMAESYVAAINQGAIPTISTAWQAAITIECQRAFEAAIDLYRNAARGAAAADPPLDPAAWMAEHARITADAVAAFRHAAIGVGIGASGGGGGGADAYEAKLLEAIASERAEVERHMAARSEAVCVAAAAAAAARANAFDADADADGLGVAERLVRLLEEGLAEYEARAAGVAKETGRRQLMDAMMLALKRGVASVEAKASSAAADAAAATARADAAVANAADASKKAADADADATELRLQLQHALAKAERVPQLEAAAAELQQLRLTHATAAATAAAAAAAAEAEKERLLGQIAVGADEAARLRGESAMAAAAAAAAEASAATAAAAAREREAQLQRRLEEATAAAAAATVAADTGRQQRAASDNAAAAAAAEREAQLQRRLDDANAAAAAAGSLHQRQQQEAETTARKAADTATAAAAEREAQLQRRLDEAEAKAAASRLEIGRLRNQLDAANAAAAVAAAGNAAAATAAKATAATATTGVPPPPPDADADAVMSEAEPRRKRRREGGSWGSSAGSESTEHTDTIDVDAVEPPPPPPASTSASAPTSTSTSASASRTSGSRRRSSVEPENLSMAVMQKELRKALGSGTKLPTKRPQLVQLYRQHCLPY